MAENEKNGSLQEAGNIEEILRRREALDQIIKDKFKKDLCILFTDICGYTKFMDARGDIEGRILLQRHNEIVFPRIEAQQGTIIKTIGDAVMATFDRPLDAVKAAVAVQEGLSEYNRRGGIKDEIHVKIGINFGQALVDRGDLFGDAVNVAARIQSQAGKDEILISENIYREVRESEDVLCRHHGNVSVKGKAQPLSLYKVIWRHEAVGPEIEAVVRSGAQGAARAVEQAATPQKILHLEVSLEGDRLKIGVHEHWKGEESTIRQYEEAAVSLEKIEAMERDLVGLLNSASREGRISRDILIRLREIGKALYEALITPSVKTKLQGTEAQILLLNLDDKLVQIPWELMNDGHQFFCQRFSMGRVVKTRQHASGARHRRLEKPLKMLVLTVAKDDLKAAYAEGTKIRDALDKKADLVNVTLRTGEVTAGFVQEKIRNFDLVHFAGHAEFHPEDPREDGWLLTEGKWTARDIMKMSGSAVMPALVFSNACQSARTEKWSVGSRFQDEIFGMANAFLLAGAKHYLGTFWEVLDEPSSRFALEFYGHLMAGVPIGEALRLARLKLMDVYGEETIVWGSYVLYGDPTFIYPPGQEDVREKPPAPPLKTVPPVKEAEVRTGEEVITFGERPKRRLPRPWIWGACAALLVAMLLWGYPGLLMKGTKDLERTALSSYLAGNYPETVIACTEILERDSGLRLPYVLLGNIHFTEGELDKAKALYQQALTARKGTDQQKAEALMGLGRVTSAQGASEEALGIYQKAATLQPAAPQAYVSQAVLLSRRGDYAMALPLLEKALELEPGDPGLRGLTAEARGHVALAKDAARQEKVDQLVKELLANLGKGSPQAPWDGWTSPPLTVWIMDFETRGHSLAEGQEQMLASGIAETVMEKTHAQMVERAILDKLLEELKLGTSRLADATASLSLGRLLAARVMIKGDLYHSGAETQVAVRMIDTETGQVKASVSEVFQGAAPARDMAERVSDAIVKKLKGLYPLRGKIASVDGDVAFLNIGGRHGVKTGKSFRVVETPLVLEAVSVEPYRTNVKAKEGGGIVRPGLRVEEVEHRVSRNKEQG
jgi:class 3 adenylate cyclase/CHAT domain-containing protein/Flp pilus assembly protein TadD